MLVRTFPGPCNVTFEAGLLTCPTCAPSRIITVAMNAQVVNGLTAAGTVRGLHTVPVLILSEPRHKVNKKGIFLMWHLLKLTMPPLVSAFYISEHNWFNRVYWFQFPAMVRVVPWWVCQVEGCTNQFFLKNTSRCKE